MRQKSVPGKEPATEVVKNIRRSTRRHFSAEDKIRIGQPARCEGWEGEQHVMQSRSIRRSGQPTRASASQNAGF